MKYLAIAATTCSGDISTCCSDYGIATFLFVLKKCLGIIQFVVPMILILMSAIGFIQLMLDPDDRNKAKMKSLLNKFKAAILVVLVPYIVNLLFGLIPDSFEISGCWKAAEEVANTMKQTQNQPARGSSNNSSIININQYDNVYADIDSNNSSNKKKDSSSSSSTKTSGKQIVKYAKKFLGNPYVYGGTSLTNGTDCSGFTLRVYEHFGISLPRTTWDQIKQGKSVTSLDQAKPGDLIFYHNVGHVAIYQGNNKIIHAKGKKYGIVEDDANYSTIAGIRRYL